MRYCELAQCITHISGTAITFIIKLLLEMLILVIGGGGVVGNGQRQLRISCVDPEKEVTYQKGFKLANGAQI